MAAATNERRALDTALDRDPVGRAAARSWAARTTPPRAHAAHRPLAAGYSAHPRRGAGQSAWTIGAAYCPERRAITRTFFEELRRRVRAHDGIGVGPVAGFAVATRRGGTAEAPLVEDAVHDLGLAGARSDQYVRRAIESDVNRRTSPPGTTTRHRRVALAPFLEAAGVAVVESLTEPRRVAG